VLFDPGHCWRVESAEEGLRIAVLSDVRTRTAFHTLTLDASLSKGTVHLHKEVLVDGEGPFLLRAPMLELWTSFLLMRGRGLLVHGLGVLHDGAVTIFAGKSGAGKSTLGHLFADAGKGHILSDDRLIVRQEEDGWRVFGTPWHGEAQFASPASGPLRAICFLRQAPTCGLVPLPAASAAARLFATCFLAGWPREEGLQSVLDICARVAARVPCAELSFTPDGRALETAGFP